MTASSSSALRPKRRPPSASSFLTRPAKSLIGKRDEAGRLVAMDVKVGDRVLFGKYSGQTVKVDGEELLVMREEDIMGVLE